MVSLAPQDHKTSAKPPGKAAPADEPGRQAFVRDEVLRAMTDDGAFRVVALRLTQTVHEVAAVQQLQGDAAARLGELLVATVLVRETMAPSLRVQGIAEGRADSGRLVADAYPDGTNRGIFMPGNTPKRPLDLGPGARLQLMRTLPARKVHSGIVEIPAPGGVSAALINYMQLSEQIVSMAAVECSLGPDGQVCEAAGFLVQLLPEVEAPPLAIMTERLSDFSKPATVLQHLGGAPRDLLQELLYGFSYTELEASPLRYACGCSSVRVMASLATLPRTEIEELAAGSEAIELRCDYCGQAYAVPPTQLRGLLKQS